MYLMMCSRPDLAYPLNLLARYVAPGRHRKVHWDAAKRVLRYLCNMSSMGLVLRGRGPVVLTSHADASWVDDSATHRSSLGYTFSLGSGSVFWRSIRSSLVLSSRCEAEIYAGAMVAQELLWLTYLLTDLGEQPRSPPVLYVDNKAMIALCQEHRVEHITKHIALRYFLARELQQRGQLRLAYVATRANTADVFTKALQSGDHQRFSTVLGLLPPPPPVSGLWTLGLPSPSPPPSPSLPVHGPTFAPPDPTPAVFPHSQPPLSPPLSHAWTSRSPHARPSSHVPVTDLRTVLFRPSQPRSSPYVLPSHPESALTASLSTLVTDYYRTYRPVHSRVLMLHSLDFSTAFLQGSLHEKVCLHRPSAFTGNFPPGTQWKLRRLVYGLRQAPREWHDTLRSTLSCLGFQPSSADPSLFVRRGSTPFFVLITRDRAARTITLSQSHMVQEVLQWFELQHYVVQRTPLVVDHILTGPFPNKPFEPIGPYAEQVGCLMYLMICTRPDLAFPLSILARFVAPGRHRPVHWTAAVRVAKYLRSTRSSSVSTSTAEAEIYAGAMAAQELRWLTFLLTDLGERPSSAPTLFTDNMASILLCREPRLESRVKHINVMHFLMRELQRHGHARFDFVEFEANTADIFTKTLPPCDHQRCCVQLGLVDTGSRLA
ncbi:unnamed protein product [Closterium sp. NIES-54]